MPKIGFKQSEEHKRKLSKTRIGRLHSEESKRKVSEGNKGKRRSEEFKIKRSEKFKKIGIGKWMKGKKHSKKTKMKMTEAHKGEKNSFWKGGITPIHLLIRVSSKYNEWRLEVFKKDNFTCQRCGEIGGDLEAHHKKSFSKLFAEARKYMPLLIPYDAAMIYSPLWNIDNGKTLCLKCHKKTKKGR